MAEQTAAIVKSERLETRITTAFLSAVFIILPLCVHNSYYDARYFKYYLFYGLCGLYFYFMLTLAVTRILRREKFTGAKLCWQDMLFPAFALAGIIGTIASGFGGEGLLAHNNREQGIITFIIYCVLFFLIKRYGKITPVLKRFMFFAFAVVCALAILNQMRVDPLGYVNALKEDQKLRFTSTVGNINFHGAYCVLLFPIPYCLFLHAGEKKQRCLYAALSVLGLMGTVAARTEGALLGLIAVIGVMPLLCTDGRAIKRHVYSFGAMLAVLGLYQLAVIFFGGFGISSLLSLLLRPLPYALALVLWAAIAFCVSRTDDKKMLRYKRIYGIVFFAAIAVLIIAIVLINLCFAQEVPPLVAKYAVISPQWGTDRGMIWERAVKIEQSFTPLQKLIGGGSGCFARWDQNDRLFENGIMDTAHNEYLHYMLTHGLLGLALYLGFLVRSISLGIKMKRAETRAIVCGCIAYGVHAIVSFAQVFTTPLFFLLLFLLNAKEPVQETEESRDSKLESYYVAIAIAAVCLLIGWLRTHM